MTTWLHARVRSAFSVAAPSPGREAFPGDIFYIHSRLAERAMHLREERGGGSLTDLPFVGTDAQNISAYIPTNPISITDGQICLSPSLFELGVLPAVDVGKPVARVGGKAQRAAYRAVAGDLELADAEQALRKAAAEVPAARRARLSTAEQLTAEDRNAVIATARQSLARFLRRREPMEQV